MPNGVIGKLWTIMSITQASYKYSTLFSFSDQPGTPDIIERKVSGCNVTLKWTTPLPKNCPIRFYTISYRQKGAPPDAIEWTVINITDVAVNQVTIKLNCTTTYEFQARAWNLLGGSTNSTRQEATTEDVQSVQSDFDQVTAKHHPSGMDIKRAKASCYP